MHIAQVVDLAIIGSERMRLGVEFEQDGMSRLKTLTVRDPVPSERRLFVAEMRLRLLKCIVEAEREFAYDIFGADWRAHSGDVGCEFHGQLGEQAAAMRPDLFADEGA